MCGSILAGFVCRSGGSRIASYHFGHQVDTEFTGGVKFASGAMGVAHPWYHAHVEHADTRRHCKNGSPIWAFGIFPARSAALHRRSVPRHSHGDS